MPNITYIQPLAQPTGAFRLLDWLEKNFLDTNYEHFRCLVAFAKIKPFYKLHMSIQEWNKRNTTSEFVIGIDHNGTSYQALQYALANFDTVQILHMNYSTFHPKLYIFQGKTKATIYYGSSNFTSGGLETNFEGGIIIDYSFPEDQTDFNEMYKCYSSIVESELECITALTKETLEVLKNQNLLMDEMAKPSIAHVNAKKTAINTSPVNSTTSDNSSLFKKINVKPARAIPKNIMTMAAENSGIILTPTTKHNKKTISKQQTTPASSTIIPLIVDGFVIQVAPHANGEIFLSKKGLKQNPSFFGYPFTGTSTPKKASNSGYPQRDPDPIVNIYVYDSNGDLSNSIFEYNLNTVLYTVKSEIRITITSSILSGLKFDLKSDDYPILVMRKSNNEKYDYDLYFYAKGSLEYANYLAICDQTLPSGGKKLPSGKKAAARKMGWL